ncbi:MAG: MFS transporter [Thermomicrobiales bacterium]|nr:MFS transporter [Thermomicrobiales bacterium]
MSRIPMPSMMRDPAMRVILILAGLAGGAFGLTIPFLTLVARERGVSLSAIGVMASSYLVAQTILQLPFGSLSDRIGRTPPIAAGFAVEALASFGFVFADSAVTFIALRVLQGISLAMIMPALRALIADVTPLHRRGQSYAWMFAAFSGGMLLGPPVGGFLAGPLGRSPLFVVAGTLNLVIAVFAIGWLRGIGGRKPIDHTNAKIPASAIFTSALIGAFVLGFGARVLEGMFAGVWSIYMDDIGASDMQIGLSFATYSVAFLLFTPIGGRMADRGLRWKKLLIGNMVLAALIMSYGLIHIVPLVLVIGLIEGAVATITVPALDAYLASVADPRIQGRIQGTYATIGTAGAAVSAFLGTALYQHSQLLPFAVAGGILVVITVAAIGLVRNAELNMAAMPVESLSPEPLPATQ